MEELTTMTLASSCRCRQIPISELVRCSRWSWCSGSIYAWAEAIQVGTRFAVAKERMPMRILRKF